MPASQHSVPEGWVGVFRFSAAAMMTVIVMAQPVIAQAVHRSHGFSSVEGDSAIGISSEAIKPLLPAPLLTMGPLPISHRALSADDRPFHFAVVATDTVVKRNRGLGAVIGGGIGLAIGAVVGYHLGDSRVPFDQLTGAAIFGGIAGVIGAVVGAVYGPRVP